MDAFHKFLAMGGYAAYVWPALALSALVLAGLAVASVKGVRRHERELAALEAALKPGREQGRDEA